MIAYEELEKALTRWKARRAGAADVDAADLVQQDDGEGAVDPDADAVTATGLPPAPDRTGELELTDAEVDEA
jgi:hypothetical protein